MKYFANWKLNLNLNESIALAKEYLTLQVAKNDEITIMPSMFAIGQVQQIVGSNFHVFAQDVSILKGRGGLTGEITATILKECGIKGSLVGHTERRNKLAENSVQVKQKIMNCTEENLEILLSIGEYGKDLFTVEDSGVFFKKELNFLLGELKPEQINKIVVACEEPMNISSLSTSTVVIDYSELHQKINYIKSVLINDLHASQTAVLYGGSVHSENIKALKQMGNLDGFVIGKASLDVVQMQAILSI